MCVVLNGIEDETSPATKMVEAKQPMYLHTYFVHPYCEVWTEDTRTWKIACLSERTNRFSSRCVVQEKRNNIFSEM